MKRSSKSLIFILILAVAVAFSFAVPAESVSAASKTKKMSVYDCIKSGDTVYCTNDHYIFKVDLKTKNVTILTGGKCYPNMLKLKGKYLYYRDSHQGFAVKGYTGELYRINVKTKAKKKLAYASYYAIKGKKIYVNADRLKGDKVKTSKRVMKLNGKSKKKTKYKVKNVYKDTNVSGYYVTDDVDWDDYYDQPANYYLRTPSGYILLESLPYPII